MNTFPIHLQSPARYEKIANVESFVGTDASGSFGVMAGHERAMTVLDSGLARFRTADGAWHYIALPGGVMYFDSGELFLSTRRYVLSEDYRTVADAVSAMQKKEDETMHELKLSLSRLEQEMLRRLWRLQQGSA